MSAPYIFSAELAASIARMKASKELDPVAQAYERGAIPTKFTVGPSAMQARPSRFAPRLCRRRLTDVERVKRRHRKRKLGGSSALPDTMRHFYTEGERAALCVVTSEVKRQGQCDLSIDEIADRAGVGRTTVQNAIHEGRRLGHLQIIERPQRGAKSLTNLIRVVSAEWRAWIRRAPSAARIIGSKFLNNVNTSENIDSKKKETSKEKEFLYRPELQSVVGPPVKRAY